MNLMDRIKGILLQPKSEWGKIDSESGDAGYLISNYVAILAAVAPICTFIGTSIIGIGGERVGIGFGLFRAIVVYVLTLIGFFVVGYIIDFLAGTFGARKDLQSAMKVSAYAPTAAGAEAGTSTCSPGSAARTGLRSAPSSSRTMFAPCASAAAL